MLPTLCSHSPLIGEGYVVPRAESNNMTSIAHGDPCVNQCAESQPISTESADMNALLAAANARLMARRAQIAKQKPVEPQPTPPPELPAHLGWGRAGLLPPAKAEPTRCRDPHGNPIADALRPLMERGQQDSGCHEPNPDDDGQNNTIIVQPSLLAGMLKGEVVSIGRVYLLCRHIDQDGRGWLAIDELREKLTGKESPLRVCGWRRLRQILQAGKGQFWERDDQGRLWLYGLTRVAALLDVQRFDGDAVELPIDALLASIGTVRATFYATFHSGRDSMPIARATLRGITGVAERTQRNYDAAQSIEIKSNYTLLQGGDKHEIYFEKGRAAFEFTDVLGKQGAAGQQYTAVRLPNSYQNSRFTRLSGKKKRLNKRLRKDLEKYGTQGNSGSFKERLYCSDYKKVHKHYNSPVYLFDKSQKQTNFWIFLDF